jgi:hypothetical protein
MSRNRQTFQEVLDGHAGRDISRFRAVCPHCMDYAQFNRLHEWGIPKDADGYNLFRGEQNIGIHTIGCSLCGMLVLVTNYVPPNQKAPSYKLVWPVESWPNRAPSDLEEHIAKYYKQACDILTLSPAASAVLARRCMQAIIRTRLKIVKYRLEDEIDEAATRTELSGATKDVLHDLRRIGNWGAHPPKTPPADSNKDIDTATMMVEVDLVEASFTLEALESLFDDLYSKPARNQGIKNKIQSKLDHAGDAKKSVPIS